jgi:hypothetical protein
MPLRGQVLFIFAVSLSAAATQAQYKGDAIRVSSDR